MIKVTEEVLEQMVRAIVREVDPERIILFGSRAGGSEEADSDVDLLVVTHETFDQNRTRRQEILKMRRVLSSFRVPKDILVYSAQEMEKWKDSLNHIIAVAIREGKTLYERP